MEEDKGCIRGARKTDFSHIGMVELAKEKAGNGKKEGIGFRGPVDILAFLEVEKCMVFQVEELKY